MERRGGSSRRFESISSPQRSIAAEANKAKKDKSHSISYNYYIHLLSWTWSTQETPNLHNTLSTPSSSSTNLRETHSAPYHFPFINPSITHPPPPPSLPHHPQPGQYRPQPSPLTLSIPPSTIPLITTFCITKPNPFPWKEILAHQSVF